MFQSWVGGEDLGLGCGIKCRAHMPGTCEGRGSPMPSCGTQQALFPHKEPKTTVLMK